MLEDDVNWLKIQYSDLQRDIKKLESKIPQMGSYPQQYGAVQSPQIDTQQINGSISDLYRRLQNIENWLPYFQQFQHRIEQLESYSKSYHDRISTLETKNSSPQPKTTDVKKSNLENLLNNLLDKISELESNNRSLQEKIESCERKNKRLNERVQQLEQSGGSSHGTVQSSIVQPAQEFQPIDLVSSRQQVVATEYARNDSTRRRDETPPPRANNNTNSRLRANQNSVIVSKYNRLIGLSGVEFKRAREDFRREYEVKAFKCGNVDARMNNPNIQPNFVDDSINGNGNYWAVPSDAASFYVFPNVRVYNDNLHNERAMGIVFDSNFQGGKTYEKVSVESPAKFSRNGNNWILERKGRLVLE